MPSPPELWESCRGPHECWCPSRNWIYWVDEWVDMIHHDTVYMFWLDMTGNIWICGQGVSPWMVWSAGPNLGPKIFRSPSGLLPSRALKFQSNGTFWSRGRRGLSNCAGWRLATGGSLKPLLLHRWWRSKSLGHRVWATQAASWSEQIFGRILKL